METEDDLHSTPLLLAVMSGNLETVEALVELEAKVIIVILLVPEENVILNHNSSNS